MTEVRWHVVMSLDGFIAGPGDATDWIFEVAGPSELAEEMAWTTGAIVMGRRTYEVEDRNRPGIYGGAWEGELFVLTHDPPVSPPEWMTGTYVDEDIESAVERAGRAAGDGKVGLLGASVARQALHAGLVDEVVVQVAPVLLGDGVRLYDATGGRKVMLEKSGVAESGALTDLRFRVLS
jgi:dihydrofolate reductase